MIVKVYTMENCPYCKELKGLLEQEGIQFEEVDINLEENQEESDKVFEITECDSVPIVRVGNKLLAPDVSFSTISEAFSLTKNFING